eukprot:c19532_g1_i1.p1 GENE.c19532_g1_i1~~c19532_g1_i1.p1  ORF type:complete len:402 (+),score=54.37 c19532_g1_i1:837-2042(+)
MSRTTLEQLADDLANLHMPQGVKVEQVMVPAFQRQGYLEKLGHTFRKWYNRFFVLRDSFLLSYNLAFSDLAAEPCTAIHLAAATIQSCAELGRAYCIAIVTPDNDRFLFAAKTEAERGAWIADLETSKEVSHANMVRLAVRNKCLAEEVGAAEIVRENSTTALAILSNEQNTPIPEGAAFWIVPTTDQETFSNGELRNPHIGEWLRTTGWNPEADQSVRKLYFVLRDSHLLFFRAGDIFTKPRGVMFLLSTVVTVNPENDTETNYPLRIHSPEFGDEITLIADSEKSRQGWIDALRVGSRVTYPDFCLLIREHELLAAVPKAPCAESPPASAPSEASMSDFIVLGEPRNSGTQQAYDAQGVPIYRNPDDLSTTAHGEEVLPSTSRTGAQTEPTGAAPKFTA